MASRSLTTFAPSSQPLSVPRDFTVERGVSTASASKSGLGCVILDEGAVFFDANEYPAAGAPALVVFGDGRMEVVPMPSMDDDPRRGLNPGFVMIRVSGPKIGGCRAAGEQAALVGAVRVAR